MASTSKISINKDIAKATLLSPDFYTCDDFFEDTKDKIFSRSWQFVVHKDSIDDSIYPFSFLEGLINEPYILINKDGIKILSNICTHRANILCNNNNNLNVIQCRYHGRTFNLSGIMKKAPGFEGVNDFPRKTDNLKVIPNKIWNGFIFTTIHSPVNIDGIFNDINSRLSDYPFEKLKYDSKNSNTYTIDAHWALYCENYLEGFHVPFIHKGLNEDIDYNNYKIELLDHGVLQYTKNKSTPKLKQILNNDIYAYYYWIFPNMMFNFYNWGLSINIIEPINKNKTRIKFLSFPINGMSQPTNTTSNLDKVEKEDQEVILSVQDGIKSYHYNKGRYSAKHEMGLHYFHQLLARYLA